MRLYEIISPIEEMIKDNEKIAIFSFGRYNPPTKGHEKLIAAVKTIAASHNGDAFIVPTKSHDKMKNPLDFATKVKFLRWFFPKVDIMDDPAIRTIFDVMGWFNDNGYNKVILVAGSDRVASFQKTIGDYIPSINPMVDPLKALDKITSFSVVSAGERDPDAEGIKGVSGTRAREFAINGQESDFINLIAPSGGTEQQKLALYKAVRKSLGVK